MDRNSVIDECIAKVMQKLNDRAGTRRVTEGSIYALRESLEAALNNLKDKKST